MSGAMQPAFRTDVAINDLLLHSAVHPPTPPKPKGHKFERPNLREMKTTCQKHCFSTVNHNLGYCYNDARVIKWLWQQARNGLKGAPAASKISSVASQRGSIEND